VPDVTAGRVAGIYVDARMTVERLNGGASMSVNMASGDAFEAPEDREIAVVGIGRRLAATLLDALVVGVFSILGATAAGVIGLVLAMYSPDATTVADRFVLAFGLAFSILYFIACWANGGQTLGDFTAMIRVVRTDGSPVTWGRAILRYLGYIVSALPLSLGFLWIAIDGRRQGWHDKIAGTYVIPSDQHFSAQDTVTFVPTDRGKSWNWLVVWAVLALVAPGALVASFWVLGPFITHLARFLAGR
jgi:uncharacterized RDD family membrane protein YckC